MNHRSFSITNSIIITNVIVFIVALILLYYNSNFIDYLALKPNNIFQLRNLWTILTSFFLHVNLSHLFVNMFSLLFIGNFVEKIIGRKRFLWLYVISGISAGIFFVFLSLIFTNEMNVYAVGASGAIFALGGLLMILTPKLKVLVFFIVPMPMFYAMLFLLAVLWLLSFLAGLPIGNTAHLGGLITGIAYGLYLKRKYKKKIAILNRMIG